jgi:hypothetical protein
MTVEVKPEETPSGADPAKAESAGGPDSKPRRRAPKDSVNTNYWRAVHGVEKALESLGASEEETWRLLNLVETDITDALWGKVRETDHCVIAAKGFDVTAATASRDVVDVQSAIHIAELHQLATEMLSRAQVWYTKMWAWTKYTGNPTPLALAFKPLAESVRFMRAHADIADKLDRRRLRRSRIDAKRAAEADPAKRAEEREQIEEALAEVGPKAA